MSHHGTGTIQINLLISCYYLHQCFLVILISFELYPWMEAANKNMARFCAKDMKGLGFVHTYC